MIAITKLNGETLYLNALLIETVEETPDTYITLVTGKRLIVLETANEVISRIKEYNRGIGIHAATIKLQEQMEDM